MTTIPLRTPPRRVLHRRQIHFDTIPQAIAEAQHVAALEREGLALYVGTWTAGQIFNHVGAWAEYAFTGIPLKIPFFVPLLLRPLRGRILKHGLPSGRNIPGVAGGTLACERVPLEEGLDRFCGAFQKLDRERPSSRHPIFGDMTHEQWRMLNLRHAELHLSFVVE